MSPQAQILVTGTVEIIIAVALGAYAYWSWQCKNAKAAASVVAKEASVEQERKENSQLMSEVLRLVSEHTRCVESFQGFIETSVSKTAPPAMPLSLSSHIQLMRDANGRFDRGAESKSAELSMAAGKYPEVFGDVSVNFVDHRRRTNKFDNVLEHAPANGTALELQQLTAESLQSVLETRERLEAKLAAAQKQIEQQAARLRSAERDARVDVLTRLSNRRAFDEHLEMVHALHERNGITYSLMILDIDHFKSVNDRFGHVGGDAVLQVTGKVLQTQLRLSDRPFRIGGEEFVLVMSATSLKQAAIVADRLRKRIEGSTVQFDGQTLNFTASIGVAEIEAGQSSGELLERADEALYAAKDAGRNRVEIAPSLNSLADELSPDLCV